VPQLDKRGVDGAEVDGQTAPKLRQLLRYRGYWYDGWDNSLGTTRGRAGRPQTTIAVADSHMT
jgi:hypothetical protein